MQCLPAAFIEAKRSQAASRTTVRSANISPASVGYGSPLRRGAAGGNAPARPSESPRLYTVKYSGLYFIAP